MSTRFFLALISTCLLFAKFSHAQEKIRIPASEPVEPGKVELRGELFRPKDEGNFPAVVLMHGCSGWQPVVRYALRNYAESLRRRSYVALLLDSFGSRHYDGNEMCSDNAKLYKALGYRVSDAFDALRYLRSLDYVDKDNVFLMGQSNGGSVALRAARASTARSYADRIGSAGFRGVIAFYPWCGLYQGTVALAAPVRVFSGGEDNWVSARECQEVRTTGADYRITVYPHAKHSFDLDLMPQKFAGFIVGGDPEAARDSRRRMFSFIARRLTADQRAARSHFALATE